MPCFRLETARLLLRPPEEGDVKAIAAFMEWDVVKNLSRAPHPYLEEHAHAFLGRQEEGRAKGSDFAFAATRKSDAALVGMCGVHLREKGFELGYWLGRPHWAQGYATEAAAEVLAFAFRNLRAEAVEAGWFHDNPASGRVLEKVGFRPDGTGQRDCAARGESVLCNLVIMSRAEFGQMQAA
jgi:ribosomal-protein-alanine N-acetyltransferase